MITNLREKKLQPRPDSTHRAQQSQQLADSKERRRYPHAVWAAGSSDHTNQQALR